MYDGKTEKLPTILQQGNAHAAKESILTGLYKTLSQPSYKRFGLMRRPCSWSHNNKSAQSNLGTRPRSGAVAHVRRKVPIGYNGAPQIRPQKYPFPSTDPQTPLPASSMDPSDL